MADIQAKTLSYGLTDASASEVLTNTDDSYTIGTPIKIAISDAVINDTIVTVESKENEIMADGFSFCEKLEVSFKFQSIDINALALINGLDKVTTGVSPNRVTTIKQGTASTPKMFNLKGQTTFNGGEISDTMVEIFCVKGWVTQNVKSGSIWDMEFKGTGYARAKAETLSDGKVSRPFRHFTQHETFTAIPTV